MMRDSSTPRLRRSLATLLLCGVSAAAPAAAGDRADVGCGGIVAALDASADAWSHGDLDGFMRVYEASPDSVYIGANGPVRGYEAIRAMYAARFGGGPGGMGALSLDVTDCRPLGPGYALVTGAYRLADLPSASGEAKGLFTLVFHSGAAGWGVISDHTSALARGP